MNQINSLLNSFFYDDNKFHHNYSQHARDIPDGNTTAVYLLVTMLIYWLCKCRGTLQEVCSAWGFNDGYASTLPSPVFTRRKPTPVLVLIKRLASLCWHFLFLRSNRVLCPIRFFFYLFLSISFSVIMIRNDDQYEQNDSLIFSGRFVFSISTIFFSAVYNVFSSCTLTSAGIIYYRSTVVVF